MRHRSCRSSWRLLAAAGMLLLVAAGCGRTEGPQRYSLRGAVTFKGEPVPLGQIAFEPDSSQGNRGPGGYADIIDGTYATHMGAISGPHRVRISGQSGPVIDETQDVTLFTDYLTSVVIDPKSTELDFDIPESAVRKSRRR